MLAQSDTLPHPAQTIADVLGMVMHLRDDVRNVQHSLTDQWRPHILQATFHERAANLAAYIGLRRHDLRPIQHALSCYGLSSLGRCEGHVLPSLDAVIHGLALMTGRMVDSTALHDTRHAIESSDAHLRASTAALFGSNSGHATRFMVTLPLQAATDFAFVSALLQHGMDCARINCAHDTKITWLRMVRLIRRAEKKTGRACRILMDLAGPKLRTGPIRCGPDILRIKATRDPQGKVETRTSFVLSRPSRSAARTNLPRVAVSGAWLQELTVGDRITLRDARGRKRSVRVEEQLSSHEWRVSTGRSLHLTARLELRLKTVNHDRKHKAPRTPVLRVPPMRQMLWVSDGDLVLLTRDTRPGSHGGVFPGEALPTTHFCCLEPRIVEALKPGHRVFIDDGKIGAVVERIDDNGAWLRIKQTRTGRAKLQSDKGINVPDTPLPFGALTDKDLADLDFATTHADIVGLSFVRHPSDIVRLSQELTVRGAPSLAVIAKIETADAVRNLPEIIAHGAGRHPFGVMIARGDLAVEIGYARLAEIQEEILWLCEAAHVPVIWATQVLETLVKKGLPSRAEMTDAAMSGRAECVMLNKGPHILEALDALHSVVTRMQAHQKKKTAQFRALHW